MVDHHTTVLLALFEEISDQFHLLVHPKIIIIVFHSVVKKGILKF